MAVAGTVTVAGAGTVRIVLVIEILFVVYNARRVCWERARLGRMRAGRPRSQAEAGGIVLVIPIQAPRPYPQRASMDLREQGQMISSVRRTRRGSIGRRPNDFECPKDTKKTKICNAYQKNKESRVRRGLPGLKITDMQRISIKKTVHRHCLYYIYPRPGPGPSP